MAGGRDGREEELLRKQLVHITFFFRGVCYS